MRNITEFQKNTSLTVQILEKTEYFPLPQKWKTLNSKMRCEGVSAPVAAALFGHSSEVNQEYYTFDVSDLDEKTRIVSKINAQIQAVN